MYHFGVLLHFKWPVKRDFMHKSIIICFDVYWDTMFKSQKVIRKVVKSPLGCFVIMFHPHVSTSFTSPGTRAPAPRGRCRIRRAFALGRVGARRRMASSGSAAGRIAGAVRPGSAGKALAKRYSYKVRYPIVSTDDLVLDIISYHVFFSHSHTVIPLSICGKTLKALTGKLHIAGTLWVHTFRTRLHCHRILWSLYWWWSPGESSRNTAEITSVRCSFWRVTGSYLRTFNPGGLKGKDVPPGLRWNCIQRPFERRWQCDHDLPQRSGMKSKVNHWTML